MSNVTIQVKDNGPFLVQGDVSIVDAEGQEFADEGKAIDKYGDNMDSALAASFHSSIEGSRVFNYVHWKSKEALKASQQTEEFKAHIDRMSYLDFTPDPRIYEVVNIYDSEQPSIDSENNSIPVLTMIYTDQQQQIIELLNNHNFWQQEGIISSHLLRSKDGERVAIYTQCCDLTVTNSLESVLKNVIKIADQVETLPYELLGSYN